MKSRVLVLRAVLLLAASRLLLRTSGTARALSRLASGTSSVPDIDPRHALRAVRRAADLVGGVCLPQSVALAALLQRSGYEPELVLGCRREESGTWTAHAWVELNGAMLEPVVAHAHESLARLSAKSGWVPRPPDRP